MNSTPTHGRKPSGSSRNVSDHLTTKVEYWDVVLEDEQLDSAILPWLGEVVTCHSGIDGVEEEEVISFKAGGRSSSSDSINASSSIPSDPSSSSSGNPGRFDSLLQELVETERSYVRRLDTLYNRYAKPLRQLSRNRDNPVIPVYEAQRLFGNVGELLAANLAFLREMEGLVQHDNGLASLKSRIGELMHRHVNCFGSYNEYLSNFEKAKHIEQNMSRNNRLFKDFVDLVKSTTPNLGNVSIRELIMEPVQRIPRYKMLLDGLLKSLPREYNDQRSKLTEAAEFCSRIASCEVDEKTQRAAVLWSFGRNVQGFPASLFSVHRKFIDAIDVDDFPFDAPGGSTALLSPGMSTAARPTPCTLFLFDDVLVVAKRTNPNSSGRKMLNLDDVNRLADEMKTVTERSGTAAQPNRKGDLGFRGVSDLADLTGLDLGGSDLQLFFKRAPAHIHHEKWNNRPLRQYATVTSSSSALPAHFEKIRFLENLWRAQALHKTRDERSQARVTTIAAIGPGSPSDDLTVVDLEPRRIVYWNIYQRDVYLASSYSRSATAVHIDLSQRGEALPLGSDGLPPSGQLRIHGIDEEYSECHYSVRSKLQREEDDVYVLSLEDLSVRLRQLQESTTLYEEQQARLSDFQPGTSQPSTPSSHRGRVVAGLETLGRSIFTTVGTPGSLRSVDIFGSPRRKGSIMSKSSMASTMTSSDRYSASGRSASTAGTSVNSKDMLSSLANGGGGNIDSNGKLMPPGGSPTSPKVRTKSSEPESSAKEKTPRRPASQIMTTSKTANQTLPTEREALEAKLKRPVSIPMTTASTSQDEHMASLSENEASTRIPLRSSSAVRAETPHLFSPNGSRGARESTPLSPSPAKRKPVPSVPEASRRMVSSGSNKRRAPEEEDEDQSGATGFSLPRVPSKRTVPPTPPKDSKSWSAAPLRQSTSNANKPLAPSRTNETHQPVSMTPSSSATKLVERSTLGIKGRIRRNLARLDEVDKENLDHLDDLSEEIAELKGAASQMESPLLGELVTRLEEWERDAREGRKEGKGMIDKVTGDVETLLKRVDEAEEARKVAVKELEQLQEEASSRGQQRATPILTDQEIANLQRKAQEVSILKTKCEAISRKCTLLTSLEKDGRLENAELHKAFNEELDGLYSSLTQSSTPNEEVRALRDEVKRTKRERNEARSYRCDLERKIKFLESENEGFRERLRAEGML